MYIYDRKEIDNTVFRFVYGCALTDAILQKSFFGKRTWIYEVSDATEEVKKYIDQLLKGNFKHNSECVKALHDTAFLNTAINVCNAINKYKAKPAGSGAFHFGNAQKLINMTVKHVYSHTYSIHKAEFPSIREHFRWSHCPMDQDMLANVWKSYDGNEYKYKKDFCAPWGCEDFEKDINERPCLPLRYITFQKEVNSIIRKDNGNVFPIEYDYIDWKKKK